MSKLSDDKIIHLMTGSRRYITILPYEEFLKMELALKKLNEKPPIFSLKFKETVLLELLDLFKGDLIKINKLLAEINKLKYDPFPLESVKVKYRTWKVLVNTNINVTYTVNKQKKLVTILSVKI